MDKKNFRHIKEMIELLKFNQQDLVILEAMGFAIEHALKGQHLVAALADKDSKTVARHLLGFYDDYMEAMFIDGITKEDVERCMSWYVTDDMRKELTK